MGTRSTFEKLLWSDFEQQHKSSWASLKEHGLQPCINQAIDLDSIAKSCIQQCWNHLFRVEPGFWNKDTLSKYLKHTNSIMVCSLSQDDLLHTYFDLALRDHLILTFAHQFYCENFECYSIYKCANTFLKCTKPFSDENEKISRDDRKTLERALEGYKTDLLSHEKLLDDYGAFRTSYCSDNYISAPNWAFSLTMATSKIKSPFKLFQKNVIEDGNEVKVGIFRFTTSGKDNFKELINFIADRDYIELLLDWQEEIPTESKNIIRKRTVFLNSSQGIKCKEAAFSQSVLVQNRNFVAIPSSKNGTIVNKLSNQIYTFKNSGKPLEIDKRIQIVFNNYLIELTYHIHALAAIENCIATRQSDPCDTKGSKNRRTKILSVPLLLYAPILHVPFIQFLNELSLVEYDSIADMKWTVNLMRSWNKELKILEELFAWSVWENFKDRPEDLFHAICDSFLHDDSSRGQRLSIFRLVQKSTSECSDPKEVKQLKKYHNQIMKSAYTASLMGCLPDEEMDKEGAIEMLLRVDEGQ